LNFKDFLGFDSSQKKRKENIEVVNMSKQGMQGACLNETCELTDEGDTTNQNNKKSEIVIKSLRAKSVVQDLSEHPQYELEQNHAPTMKEMLLVNANLNNTMSSLGSIDDIDESLL
jgi:hypothetical protein